MEKQNTQLNDDMRTNFRKRKKFQFNDAIGFFFANPKTQRPVGTQPAQALEEYGLVAKGEKQVFYLVKWQGNISNSSDYTAPDGWTVSGSTGDYTVTHNLGDQNYFAFAQPTASGSSEKMSVVYDITNTTFKVRSASDDGNVFSTPNHLLVIHLKN